RIGQVLAMKYPTRNISVGQNRRFLADLELRHIADQIQVSRPPRLLGAFELSDNQRRNVRRIISELVLPPAYGQVAPERFAVVQIRADHRSLEVQTLLHKLAD